jgi:Uncharacterized protein conserved in bacteria
MLFAGMFLCLLSSLSYADPNKPTISDSEYRQYTELSNDFKLSEQKLNEVYKGLVSTLNNEEKEKLKLEQREWIKTRDIKTFNVGPKGGPIYIESLIKNTKERTFELQSRIGRKSASEITPVAQPKPTEVKTSQKIPTETNSKQPDTEKKDQIVKYAIIFLILISCLSVFLHLQGKLIIYKDYTDAAVTIGGVIVSIIIFYTCKNFLNISEFTSKLIACIFFFVNFIFVFRMTYITNSNIIYTTLSLLTRYTTTFLYVILMFGLMFSGSSRKKGESDAAFERRSKRESEQSKAWMVALTALMLWFVHITTKFREWSLLGDYLSLSFKKLDLHGERLSTDNIEQ